MSSCVPQRRPDPNVNFSCDIETVLKIKSTYADAVYAMFKRMRYGIDTCCEYDLDKADIKNMKLDLDSMIDPNLCVDIELPFQGCCPPPCNIIAELQIPMYTGCSAPEGASAILSIV